MVIDGRQGTTNSDTFNEKGLIVVLEKDFKFSHFYIRI